MQWLQGLNDQEVPGYDVDLSRVQEDVWQMHGEANVCGPFFYAAFFNHNFHGFLSSASIHMFFCFTDFFHRTGCIGEYQRWMTMPAP